MGRADKEALQARIDAGIEKEKENKRKELEMKAKAERKKFGSEFKKFITKGNVIDLAVAVVIGSAFSAITNGLVKFIINPVISLLTNGISLSGWKTVLQPEELYEAGEVVTAEIAILWGEWVQTIVQFFIIAFVIFIALRIIKKGSDTLRAKEIEAQKIADEKKKAEEKAAADAAAAVAAAKEAQLQEFYANVKRQTELLEKLSKDNLVT